MRPSQALAIHGDEVLAIIARYPVSNPRIFGSVARGEDSEGSDLDLLVDGAARLSTFYLAGLEIDLESLLRSRVDVRTAGELSPHVATRVNLDLKPL